MTAEPLLLHTLRDMGRATLRWSAQWVYIARLAAQIMAWALSPGSYPRALRLPDVPSSDLEIRRVVTVFRELRSGATEDGRVSLKVPSGSLSKIGRAHV